MSLNLSATQPSETDAEKAPTAAPNLVADPNPEPTVFATFVSEDGRILKLARGSNGILVLQISRNEPFILDRFQAVAFGLAAGSIEKAAS